MSASKRSPVTPDTSDSAPSLEKPSSSSASPAAVAASFSAADVPPPAPASFAFAKGVASTNSPLSAPALEHRLSSSIPIVIREGKACGLMIRSGRIPDDSAKGMSASGHGRESTPFWPWRDENLSPTTGLRLMRTVTEARWRPATPPPEPPEAEAEEEEATPQAVTRSTTATSSPFILAALALPVVESTLQT